MKYKRKGCKVKSNNGCGNWSTEFNAANGLYKFIL